MALAAFVFLIIYSASTKQQIQLLWLLPIVLFGVTFTVSYLLIKSFLTDKINIIYKTIFPTAKGTRFKAHMRDKSLNQVGDQVKDFSKRKNKEISELKDRESYQREFVGNVAHELKTPIFNIQGYLLTLLEGGLEDERINRNFLERAAKSVNRMISIVEDLDFITKLDSEATKLNKTTFNIVELVKEVQDELDFQAKESKIELRFDKNYEKPIMVTADRFKIHQALLNLMVNSIKYGKERGTTETRFKDVGKKVLIEIADNGPGIDEEHLGRIFERFYRIETSRSRDRGGSGLGLAIVKKIIEEHNQTITVRSRIDVGSTFSFSLEKP